MDNAAGHLEAFNGDDSRVNFNDLKAKRASGSYNQPLNNTTTLVYDLPYGRAGRTVRRQPGIEGIAAAAGARR